MCSLEFWFVTKTEEETLIVTCVKGVIFDGVHPSIALEKRYLETFGGFGVME